jgi:hypothetical protein
MSITEFLVSKEAKRFYWTTANGVMGLLVAYLTLMASDNVPLAITLLPIATAASQMLTKYLNS